jgi:hypothetical protein
MVLLVEAHSEKELYEILKGLPLWGEQVEVEVTRMWDYEELEELDETSQASVPTAFVITIEPARGTRVLRRDA